MNCFWDSKNSNFFVEIRNRDPDCAVSCDLNKKHVCVREWGPHSESWNMKYSRWDLLLSHVFGRHGRWRWGFRCRMGGDERLDLCRSKEKHAKNITMQIFGYLHKPEYGVFKVG